jgi:hypothetical protein
LIAVCAGGDGCGRRGFCWSRAIEQFASSLLSSSAIGVVGGEDGWVYADVAVAGAGIGVKVRLPLCT